MRPVYRATLRRITRRIDWDRSGVFLAALLFLNQNQNQGEMYISLDRTICAHPVGA